MIDVTGISNKRDDGGNNTSTRLLALPFSLISTKIEDRSLVPVHANAVTADNCTVYVGTH